EAVRAGHLDVEQRDVGLAVLGRGGHLVPPAYLGDDLDVVLERQQRGEGLPDHHLVLGQQHPDHTVDDVTPGAGAGAGCGVRLGTVAVRLRPGYRSGRTSRVPPTALSRSDMPRRPDECGAAPAGDGWVPQPPAGVWPLPSSRTVRDMAPTRWVRLR